MMFSNCMVGGRRRAHLRYKKVSMQASGTKTKQVLLVPWDICTTGTSHRMNYRVTCSYHDQIPMRIGRGLSAFLKFRQPPAVA